MSSAPFISLESVSKRYGSATVVHDLSFTVARGEIVGFLGPNGAGKTTTMRMIAGLIAATSGRVTVAGFDMASQNEEGSRRIGYLPERPPLYDALDVSTYLRFVARVKGVRRAAMATEVERVCAACRLEAVTRREIYKLSKGYRQRLGLAQALLGDPDVLLLDEPTAGLDPGQIHETREVIRAFGRDRAVLFSTHILAEVTLICGRVAIIDHGRLLAIDSPTGLQRAVEQTGRVVLEVTGSEAGLRERLAAVDGVRRCRDPERAPPTVASPRYAGSTATRRRRSRDRARGGRRLGPAPAGAQQPTLENIFLQLRGGEGRPRGSPQRERDPGRLPEGAVDLLPLPHRLLRGRRCSCWGPATSSSTTSSSAARPPWPSTFQNMGHPADHADARSCPCGCSPPSTARAPWNC